MPHRSLPRSWFIIAALTLAAPAVRAAVDFSHQIVPLLREHCAECHAGDKKKGGFSFNDRESLLAGGENGKVVRPGASEKSMLIEAVLSRDPDTQMPPKGARLPAEKITLLKAWIDEGLPWEEGFAFKKPSYEPPLKPRQVELPAPSSGRTNPVDRILGAYLAQKKLPHPRPLDDAAFLRRASLDLTGLLPEPETLQKFLADRSPEKRARLVHSLLEDDIAYTEHWLTFWNDLLRNDYSGTGFITGGRKQISRWLYDALAQNKPFDQFARELIAPPADESAGFINGIKWRGDVSAGQTVEIQFAQSVSQSFLGINLKCASCHDSFVDRWKLDEAYGLAAVYSTRPLEIARCDKPTGKKAQASWLFPELGQVDARAPQPERLRQLAALMTHPQNGRFTRTIVNRLWHRLMGRGIVHPVDAMQTEPWNADLLDFLAMHLAENGFDLKKTMNLIVLSQAYQSRTQIVAKDADDHGYVYAGPRAKRLTAEQFVDAVWQITGAAPQKFDAPVTRGKADPAAVKDLKLQAQWVWGDSAKNNRPPPSGETLAFRKNFTVRGGIAQAGAVVTCDNEFTLYVNNREAAKSADWQSPVFLPLASLLRDGANSVVIIAKNAGAGPNAAGLFIEGRIRHADGREESLVTDASWEWNKNLPTTKEGRIAPLTDGWSPVTIVPPVPAWTTVVTAKAPPLLAQTLGGGTPRMVRASLVKSDFLQRALGRPNRDQIVSVRPAELTTLEAIDLSNGQILATLLEKGSKNLLMKSWPTPEDFARWLYRFALSRDPSPKELAAMKESCGGDLNEQAVQDLLWSVLMLPEFQLVR